MNIFPMNTDEAKKKHWVVRWLRNIGFLIIILCTVAGIVGAYQYIQTSLNYRAYGAEKVILYVLGGIGGLLVGLGLSLPYWAISLLLDDIHALRVYASGYVTVGDDMKDKIGQ